jgi:hypothetical protein
MIFQNTAALPCTLLRLHVRLATLLKMVRLVERRRYSSNCKKTRVALKTDYLNTFQDLHVVLIV